VLGLVFGVKVEYWGKVRVREVLSIGVGTRIGCWVLELGVWC
jgi:hypothetical protein